MSGLDFFREPSTEELKKRQEELERINKRITLTAELGKECLGDRKFQRYKEEYEKCRETILDFMISYADPDPIKDAFFLRSALGQIKILKMLLDSVLKDAKKGAKK